MSITVKGQATLARGATPASTQAVPTGKTTITGQPIYGAAGNSTGIVASAQSLLTKVNGNSGSSIASGGSDIPSNAVAQNAQGQFIDAKGNVIGMDDVKAYISGLFAAQMQPNFSRYDGQSVYVPPPNFTDNSSNPTPPKAAGSAAPVLLAVGALLLIGGMK